LNPAVSIGSFAAAKAASHSVPVGLFSLYFLSPFVGAAFAALFFYFVQGGLTDQFEYENKKRRTSYIVDYLHMKPGEEFVLNEELMNRKLYFGFQYETKDESIAAFEVDAALVKYDKDGNPHGDPIYYNNHEGQEIRGIGGRRKSVCQHETLSRVSEVLESHHQKDAPHDGQWIYISSLSQLQEAQKKVESLFFTVSYFSGDHALKRVSIRLVDAEGNKNESLCRFEKQNIKDNNILMGVLYHRDGQWIFRIIDEGTNTAKEASATYRQLADKMEKWVQRLQRDFQPYFRAGSPVRR
jgi:stress response protein SCP2